jgi:hypothetical protein
MSDHHWFQAFLQYSDLLDLAVIKIALFIVLVIWAYEFVRSHLPKKSTRRRNPQPRLQSRKNMPRLNGRQT